VSELSPERPIPGASVSLRRNFIAYVSGTLAAAERDDFEERLLKDEEFSQLTALLEEDVLEDYAAGSLTSAEQKSLRPWIMSSARRREHVQVTRLLLQSSRPRLQTRKSVWLWLWLTAAACVISAALLFVRHRVPSAIPTASSKPVQVSSQPIFPKANVILLVAERLRGSATQNESAYVVRPEATTHIQVLLPGAENRMRYSLLLRPTDDDRSQQDLVRVDGLAAQNASGEQYIEIKLPPGQLSPGAYLAEVRSRDGSFAVRFRVSAPSKTR
jgi:anti-sigma factor RsiW